MMYRFKWICMFLVLIVLFQDVRGIEFVLVDERDFDCPGVFTIFSSTYFLDTYFNENIVKLRVTFLRLSQPMLLNL